MISIRVLGPGCSNCERVELHAIEAVEQLKSDRPELEATIEKVNDTEVYMEYGLLATPGLVINEHLVSAGKIPSTDEIVRWIETNS